MRRVFVALVWVLLSCAAPVRADDALSELLASIRDQTGVSIDTVPLLSERLLAQFYAGRDKSLVWVDRRRIEDLLGLVEQSPADGFHPDDFHGWRLRFFADPQIFVSLDASERARADLILSDALLRYIHHQRYGKVDPVAVDRTWHDRPPPSSERLLADMAEVVDATDLAASLAGRFPRPFWYAHLKLALKLSESEPNLIGLPRVPGGKLLALGSRDLRVAMVRERLLRLEGEELSQYLDSELFDSALHESVLAFQQRSGLTPDGVVGSATLAAINGYGDAQRVEQIRINLERMRWLDLDLPPDYVFVDVAGYKVHLARGGRFVWSTRAIVGTVKTQTPMFRDTMDHLVFNPTWTVPESIQKKMGRISGDFRVVDRQTGKRVGGGAIRDHRRYALVQAPGPKNALGRVKFMFPNRHAIYLHDTPAKALFGRQTRALSNGCIRVENPLEFAEAILNQSHFDQAGIGRLVARGQTRYLNLSDPLPVLLYYLTAFADEAGHVVFRSDVYERDAALRRAFSAPVLAARIAFPDPPAPLPTLMPEPDAAPALGPEHPGLAPDLQSPLPDDTNPSDSTTSVRLTGQDDAALTGG